MKLLTFTPFFSFMYPLNMFEDRKPALEEYAVQGIGKSKIALISINGAISSKSVKGFVTNEPEMVQSLVSRLRLAANDPEVRAVMIR